MRPASIILLSLAIAIVANSSQATDCSEESCLDGTFLAFSGPIEVLPIPNPNGDPLRVVSVWPAIRVNSFSIASSSEGYSIAIEVMPVFWVALDDNGTPIVDGSDSKIARLRLGKELRDIPIRLAIRGDIRTHVHASVTGGQASAIEFEINESLDRRRFWIECSIERDDLSQEHLNLIYCEWQGHPDVRQPFPEAVRHVTFVESAVCDELDELVWIVRNAIDARRDAIRRIESIDYFRERLENLEETRRPVEWSRAFYTRLIKDAMLLRRQQDELEAEIEQLQRASDYVSELIENP